MVGHSTKRKISTVISSAPSHEVLRKPVLGFNSCSRPAISQTEVTPKAKRQKAALVKIKLKELSEDLQYFNKESSVF